MKSFLQGRPVQEAPALRSIANPGIEGMTNGKLGHQHVGEGGGPSVECVKQGEKVVRLIVTCTCGERIEIECLYPAGG